MEEIWKDIPGYEGHYMVSNLCRVRSLKHKKVKYLKPQLNSSDRDYVNLTMHGKTKCGFVYRLAALAFIPNPNNYPVINHIDGNHHNNCLENLEWCTQKHNIQHAFNTGLIVSVKGSNVGSSILNENDIFRMRDLLLTDSFLEVSKIMGISRETVRGIASREQWKHLDIDFSQSISIKRKNRKSKFIFRHKKYERWVVLIKNKYCGMFKTEQEAIEKRNTILNAPEPGIEDLDMGELKERLNCATLKGEYIGTIKAVLHWDIPEELKEKLKVIIKELEDGKDKRNI